MFTGKARKNDPNWRACVFQIGLKPPTEADVSDVTKTQLVVIFSLSQWFLTTYSLEVSRTTLSYILPSYSVGILKSPRKHTCPLVCWSEISHLQLGGNAPCYRDGNSLKLHLKIFMTWEFEEEVETLVVYVVDKGDEVLYAVWDYNKVRYMSSQKCTSLFLFRDYVFERSKNSIMN